MTFLKKKNESYKLLLLDYSLNEKSMLSDNYSFTEAEII